MLKVWDVEKEGERATLLGHAFWVTGCAIGPDGSLIVSSGEGGLKLSEVEQRVLRPVHRDLDRFGVSVKRVVEVEILGGQVTFGRTRRGAAGPPGLAVQRYG